MVGDSGLAKHTQEECGAGGCLMELVIQLATVMIGKQAIGMVSEMSIPIIKLMVSRWRMRSMIGDNSDPISQCDADYALSDWGPRVSSIQFDEIFDH